MTKVGTEKEVRRKGREKGQGERKVQGCGREDSSISGGEHGDMRQK